MLYVRLMIIVKVGIPESFKVGWYRHKITGSSHLKVFVSGICLALAAASISAINTAKSKQRILLLLFICLFFIIKIIIIYQVYFDLVETNIIYFESWRQAGKRPFKTLYINVNCLTCLC